MYFHSRIKGPIAWLLLAIVGLLFIPLNTVSAQANGIQALANSPLYGNYCTALGGVSLSANSKDVTQSQSGLADSFELNVPGTPVQATWFWSGRSLRAPQLGDNDIVVAANGSSAVTLTAGQGVSQVDGSRTWHTYLYQDSGLTTVQSGLNAYTVSGLNINGHNEENHGAALLVIYEDASCPYQKIELNWGLDSFRHSSSAAHLGPDSELYCQSFDAAAVARPLTVNMIVGGVENDLRGNAIWTMTGNGALPTGSITPDNAGNAFPGATMIDDALNNNAGAEFDLYTTQISVPAGDTYACFQIESKVTQDDKYGISAVLPGFATSWPMTPPAIDIQKTPDLQTIVAGSEIPFTIRVENIGSVLLNNVTVTDKLAPNCDAVLGTLAPGEVKTFECTLAGANTSFTNVVEVVGQPAFGLPVTDTDDADVVIIHPSIAIDKTPDAQMILAGEPVTFTISVENTGDVTLTNVQVTDALSPNCDANLGTLEPAATASYDCQLDAATANFTNIAFVTGQPPVGDKVQDENDAVVIVIHPAITITKSPDGQSVEVGKPVNFTIVVQNSGDVALTNVNVVDALTPACDRAIGNLAVNEKVTYECALAAASESFINIARVSGKPPVGPTVSAKDDAKVTVLGPAIDIQKTPDLQSVPSGSAVDFTITVTNIGDTALNNVAVTDAIAPVCNKAIGAMPVGQVVSYSCTMANVTDNLVNIAKVSGTSPAGTTVADEDSAAVETANVAITKSPETQMIVAGSPVTFKIEVVNTGNVTLSNVTVTDPQTPQCDKIIGQLAAGQSHSYACTLPAATESFVNLASVMGELPNGAKVTDEDSAVVTVIHPAVVITKTPDLQTVLANAPIPFTIRVKNVGDVTLTNVTVSDPRVTVCDKAIGTLEPGDYVEYDCLLTSGTKEDFTNVASVTGQPPVGAAVTDSDSAMVDLIAPALSIEKLPDMQMVRVGETALFTIVVKNTGDTPLYEVAVQDELTADCNRQLGDLQPGDSRIYFCEASNVKADFTNVADVVGNTILDTQLVDSGDAVVDLINPSIEITKTAQKVEISLGETAIFNIEVKNNGDVTLTNVMVSDQIGPDCNRDLGTLAAGEAKSYSCEMPNIRETTTNVASVSGVPPVGPSVQDQDDAMVEVPTAKVAIAKVDDVDVIQPNGLIHYTISYKNEGPGDAFDVFIIEVVPAHTSFDAKESAEGWVCEEGAVNAGTACRFNVGDLPVNKAGEVIFSVKVNSVVPQEVTAIVNQVTIDGINLAPFGASNIATENTPIAPTALDTVDEPGMVPSKVLRFQIFVPLAQN